MHLPQQIIRLRCPMGESQQIDLASVNTSASRWLYMLTFTQACKNEGSTSPSRTFTPSDHCDSYCKRCQIQRDPDLPAFTAQRFHLANDKAQTYAHIDSTPGTALLRMVRECATLARPWNANGMLFRSIASWGGFFQGAMHSHQDWKNKSPSRFLPPGLHTAADTRRTAEPSVKLRYCNCWGQRSPTALPTPRTTIKNIDGRRAPV
jgi:hypothetical protein